MRLLAVFMLFSITMFTLGFQVMGAEATHTEPYVHGFDYDHHPLTPVVSKIPRSRPQGDDFLLKSHKAVFPIEGGCSGIRNDDWGHGRFGARRRGRPGAHKGVDWYALSDTPLISPWPGRVELAGDSGKGGNRVRIIHDNGFKTVFMHMEKVSVSEGQTLKQGETIGTVGKTGNADEFIVFPHVHFELHDPKGNIVNPSKVFGCDRPLSTS